MTIDSSFPETPDVSLPKAVPTHTPSKPREVFAPDGYSMSRTLRELLSRSERSASTYREPNR